MGLRIPTPHTGLTGLDTMLHGLRPGDNVVLRVDDIDDYLPFVTPYWRNAVAEGRKLIYFRFAKHPRLLPDVDGVETVELHPEMGFERFLTELIDIIEAAGLGAFYVFDCLSELAVDWYSDRMLANFFMITCPFLYDLDTIAYFALLKHRHSSLATDGIHNTAQVVMNIYRTRERIYVQPLKVDKRYSPTMFLVHSWEGDAFSPVTSSAILSEIFEGIPHPWLDFASNRPGVWTRTFMDAQEVLGDMQVGRPCDDRARYYCQRLLRMAFTRETRISQLAEQYFDLADLVGIMQRMIGSGLIGGKSLGMLLARRILTKRAPGWRQRLEAHDSFYVGSDVFYTYIVQNGCWWLRRRQRDEAVESYIERAAVAGERMMHGTFPVDIESQFMEMLDYFGQSPIIVRSSSLLEDNYGNAFSGKYESVFCANQGSPRERLDTFMAAVRKVYASTMGRDALVYREQRGLLDKDEQMGLLVQRVSGAAYGATYFPHLAGVGYSFNTYVWDEDIDPAAGVIRLVFGLGTRAVDRTDDDYTRLLALNAPGKRPHASEDTQRFVQKRVDVLDLTSNELTSCPFESLVDEGLKETLDVFASQDYEMLERARKHGIKKVFPWSLSFDKLIRDTDFVPDMRNMLATLQEAYDHPVDIEFTANFLTHDDYLVNLVQCRPFQVKIGGRGTPAPGRMPENRVAELLATRGPIIGRGLATTVDRLVYVVPGKYGVLAERDRYAVARLIGKITHLPDSKGWTIMLIGPGRWGTSTPSLGVPVSFPEINTTSIICEVALMHEGLVPDISLGTHFFNDLVELDMLYLAVSPGQQGHQLNQSFFAETPNRLTELVPDAEGLADIVRVFDRDSFPGGEVMHIVADSMVQTATCCLAEE